MSAMYRLEGEDAASCRSCGVPGVEFFMERYVPSVSKSNGQAVYGYLTAKLIMEVLKNCGDDFAREHHEAGPLDQGLSDLDDGAGHPDQHQPVRPRDRRADAHDALHQRPLAVLRPVRSGIDPAPSASHSRRCSNTAPPPSAIWPTSQRQHGEPDDRFVRSTYAQMGADMASVLDNGTSLRILPVMGCGSVQAVSDILLLRGVDAGIVRSATRPISTARTSPRTSATSSSTSPRCSTRKCTSWRRRRTPAFKISRQAPSRSTCPTARPS